MSSTPPFVSPQNCFAVYCDFTNNALYVSFGTTLPFRKVSLPSYTEDTTWTTNVGVVNGLSYVNGIQFAQTDQYNRTYITGGFSRWNNQNYNRLIRLNSNGTSNTLGS